MFEENKFARANGNEDMAIAIGELKIDRVCEAVKYNKMPSTTLYHETRMVTT